MKIIGPVDLIPEASPIEQWVQMNSDQAWIRELEKLIKGKLILTGDGHGD